MLDSNWTLRFPRSSREAYGHEIYFERKDPDRLVWVICVVLGAFLLGMFVGQAFPTSSTSPLNYKECLTNPECEAIQMTWEAVHAAER